MAAPTTARGRWLDPLLAERQVYVRGRGQPYFVTVTRRARTLRALAFLALLLTVLGLGTALAVGYQRYAALRDELAHGSRPVRPQVPVAEPAEERTAREVAGRSRDAELEAAHARSALLEGQLASAGQARDRALADLQAARQELDTARAAAADLAALRAERDRLVAELAAPKAQPAGTPAAVVPAAAPDGPRPRSPPSRAARTWSGPGGRSKGARERAGPGASRMRSWRWPRPPRAEPTGHGTAPRSSVDIRRGIYRAA